MDMQQLIGEVAKRHRVILNESDPIFITITLNDLLLAEHVERMRAIVEENATLASASTAQQVEATKKLASQLITGAGVYVTDQFKAAGDIFRAQMEQDIAEQKNCVTKYYNTKKLHFGMLLF
jgi:TRAP-type C4-dicarboxylate transport system substrate-binding protein